MPDTNTEPTTTQIGYEDHVPTIEISIANVEADAPDSPLFGKVATSAKTEPSGITTDYQIRSYYESDGHKYMFGVTATGNSPSIVQLAGKTLLWICDWTASKLKLPPTIPNPSAISSKWVLLDEHYVPVSVITTNDGQFPLYRISGTYIYGCIAPDSKTYNDVNFPIGAWIQDTFSRIIKEEYLSSTLMESSSKQQSNSNNNQQTRG